MNEDHPTKSILVATRERWFEICRESDPWPEDWATRCKHIDNFTQVHELRLKMLEEQPVRDGEVTRMRNQLRAHIESSKQLFAEHGYVRIVK